MYLEKVGRVGEFRRRFFDLVVGRSEFYQRLVVVEAARQLLERVLGDVDELDLAQLTHRVRQPAAQIISQVAYLQKNEANYSEILRRGLLQLSASTRTKFGERAFSHAGPATWNALPDNIRTVPDPVKFRKLLTSLYFGQAFNI